ncbi:ATP-binding protein [Collimonas sp.]|jgi:signal transduction histidine kinase|uniref:ATP-binding protein n=1 Tax=Collimonas sp. TaxID=1963772 RepID=UPI002C3625B4|nr:ATP-binding protein [Collimonas sp.]HWW07591.1 ATP-binding protein [Collimonas sp.]
MNDQTNAGEVLPAAGGSLAEQIFAGKGEMASLIRATDWSKTPLGPIEAWPQSLRTAVSICLGSRHPIVLWWGPERWMFYNDGYRPLLGGRKHPQYLGRPGQECWAEIWDIIGPMMDQVIDTGEATWSEDLMLLMLRYSYLEETYYTFSYSPIRDETGRPSGIFNACTESTARVLDRRRLKTLREMAIEARTTNEAARLCAEILVRNRHDIPFALVYLEDSFGKQLHLAGYAGLEPGTAASPLTVDMTDADAIGWPLARVAGHGRAETVENLADRFDCLPREPWDEPAHQAMLQPIAHPGTQRLAGVLVLGISPRRAFDDDYRGFFDLVAGHVATAVSNARAFEEERERAEKLTELDRVKTTFFSNVSHEFRTPLTLILGPLEDALSNPGRVLRGDSLETVHRSALRLLRLVNSLLDFSRIEANRLTSSFEPIDLPVFTGGLAGSFQSLVESAGLKLIVDCPPQPEPAYVDRTQWEKIVLNLISNAFKFTFEGEITIRLQAADGKITLSVIDTGTGIPAEELPKIFERFHRIEGARGRSFEGTGIGLALVHELVKQHGGEIRAESVFGKGSTFIVTIPAGTDHLPKDRILSESRLDAETVGTTPHLLEAAHWLRGGNAGTAGAAPLAASTAALTVTSGARVLVADDNADMREYLVRLLSSRWLVEAVVDGQAALDSALERPPDLVLSDVMMPRMDGAALLRALRADPRTSTVPVVLLSARAGEEAIISGLEIGADDYLVKPFSGRELISRVATHMEMARMRRAAADIANELAETRAALLKNVEQKNQELEAFSYSISHDLRAPLRTIDGFSQALLEDHAGQLDAQGQHYLQRVRTAAKRMGELIDDLLELARVERVNLRREPVDLARLGKRICDLLANSEPDRKVAFIVNGGLVVDADSRLAEIILENLLGNAWKFTTKTPAPQVELGSVIKDGQTTFYVKDNGAGFNQAYAGNLFAPFQRLHSEREFPGTGIGLATVRRIVERHGGRVWAEGQVDQGAAIYWTLPSPRHGALPGGSATDPPSADSMQ